MYHVGRPGEDGYANRVLQAWGLDGHNSHTNVCSSSARLGHFLWCGNDRPSPDYANAQTILLLSSHLETGHYFNPHAQRIIEGQSNGATLIVIDPRLSNTSAKANMWLPAYSGTEGALLLAMVKVLLDEELYDREFVRTWVDWRGYLRAERPDLPVTFDNFIVALKELYAQFTPEFAADGNRRRRRADRRGGARDRPRARHASARTTGAPPPPAISGAGRSRAASTCSSCSPDRSAPKGGVGPAPVEQVRPEASEPRRRRPSTGTSCSSRASIPLAFFEMSFLLPHLPQGGPRQARRLLHARLQPAVDQPRRLLVDGDAARTSDKIGLHVALTPTWSETAWFADYILPMGLGTERHDTMSQETHAGAVARLPPAGAARRAREARRARSTPPTKRIRARCGRRASSGSRSAGSIDPDGSLGIRKHFESPVPSRPAGDDGRVLRVDVRELGAGPARSGREGSS